MPRLNEAQRARLEAALPSDAEAAKIIRDYMRRANLTEPQFAQRIGYGRTTLQYLLNGRYHLVGSSLLIKQAALSYIKAHPLNVVTPGAGRLYDTENVRIIEECFHRALDEGVAYCIVNPPGAQKTFPLEHLVARLNRREIAKNGHGKHAYFVRCRPNIRPCDLVKRMAEACGADTHGNTDRVLRNIRDQIGGRRALFGLDEAHFLDWECIETVRELLDLPPYVGLLFLGDHNLRDFFARYRMKLQQWTSGRLHAIKELPGLSEAEVRLMARSEMQGLLPRDTDKAERVVQTLVEMSRDKEPLVPQKRGDPSERPYYSARRLFRRIAEVKREHAMKKAGAA